jgi:transcriptional regulator with XRE-family HTH domain
VAGAAFERAVARRTREIADGFGQDVRRLREDAGVRRSELARAASIDPSYLTEIEDGVARPSLETCARLSLALGADLSQRLYPTTGPAIRDRHQSAIVEATLRALHPRWRAFSEIAVQRPSRGWIDLGLHDAKASVFVATEIQSELRRLEQLVRWSEAKAAALRSWDGWTHLGNEPTVSRLLIVRETRTNRAIAHDHPALAPNSVPRGRRSGA